MSAQTQTIEEPVTCRICGTKNDQYYTYCRECLGQLPARPDSRRQNVN